MAKVERNEAYSVYVLEMDEQHKRLHGIINRLHEALMAEDSVDLRAAKDEAMLSLGKYLAEHFYAEEEYMKSIGYPDLAEHQQEHQNFHDRLQRYKQNLHAPDGLRPTEIMKILVNWLHDHLQGEDKKYGKFALSQ